MKIGAHVSASGGLDKAISRAQEIGAETIQLFASSPRAWAFHYPDDQTVSDFRRMSKVSDISPIFIHGSYLVNLAGKDDLIDKSVELLIKTMEVASLIGADGVIFHGGSHRGVGFEAVFTQAVSALKRILRSGPSNCNLILENSAGMGSHIGSSFTEIGSIVSAVNMPNLKVCLDTQHCHASGYRIADSNHIESVMESFDTEIGLDRLAVVHANDSKIKFGSGVDRHENIGQGDIGIAGFEAIMGRPEFSDVPFILEVPGFDGNGPDQKNLDLLKDVRKRVTKTS